MEALIVKSIILIINIIAIWLIILVNVHKSKKGVIFLFRIMVVLMLIWVNFGYLARITHPDYGLLFIRLAWAITPLFSVFIYLFIKDFLREKNEKYSLFEKILVVLGIINIPIVFQTSLVIHNIWFDQYGTLTIIYGKGVWIFFSIIFLLTALSFYFLLRAYIKSLSSDIRTKIRYLLIGLSFFFLMNSIFNIIYPVFFGIFHLYEFGDYSTIIFLSFIAYAIVKKELFGIKVVLTSLLVGLITILFTVDLFVFTPPLLYLQIFKSLALVIFLIFGRILIKSVSQEIKKREQLEQLTVQLKKANIKLKELDKTKSEFLSIASHQLRTPLSAVKGYLSMILEKTYGDLPEKIKKPLKSIDTSNERLIKLVNDILNVSRIEAGKMEVKLEKTSLSKIITTIVEELKIETEKKNIKLKWEEPQEGFLPKILIDKNKIRQVIINILKNAIRYTEKGEITIQIKIQNKKYKIQISDTGAGMTKDELSKIFKSFSRGKAGNRFFIEGSGLGLYVAKKFIKMHKGEIWAESKGRNKGSTFYVELPLKKN